ncbi:protease pro-enzyme activation domain-containing protein [Acidilobus sp. 7A]|uniref:S53 family peptidase n=1 Tax=Acidilobus sp. 7A TaxID=1577685 RepID=UPI000764ECB1|nr:protease pro-enzyme activation domain-containing protein [Acidilobus sp. 7A]AMD30169.1 hypothetical protein SE86_00580 [Acidilobus sp. 7A]
MEARRVLGAAIAIALVLVTLPELPATSAQGTPVIGVLYVPLRDLPLVFLYAEEASTPGSPLYGHFMNSSVLSQALPPPSQVAQAEGYLESRGLRVMGVIEGSLIVFEGLSSQLPQAFGGYPVYGSYDGQPFYVYSAYVPGLGLVFSSNLSPSPDGLIGRPSSPLTPRELQEAYNVTPLLEEGVTGSGVQVGIIAYYGDPYLGQALGYYDEAFDLPPARVSFASVGPYNPSLGVYTGWSNEVEADAEVVHAVAPGSGLVLISLYPGLPLSAAVAEVDQLNETAVVLQTFNFPEGLIGYAGYSWFFYNVYLSDIYYALGAAEGITFVAAAGDNGGLSSFGPLGALGYPASSPWVLSVGGLTTFLGNYTSLAAWSATGSTGTAGGASGVEPMPWWQALAAGKVGGREVPDVSADASPATGVPVINASGHEVIAGGTSVAASIVAGELAVIEQAVGHRLGLAAPALYMMYRGGCCSSSTRSALMQASLGYSFPWVVGSGYNAVTGLGAINAGEAAYWLRGERLLSVIGPRAPMILVNVTSLSSQGPDLLPGQEVHVEAVITYQGRAVSSGCAMLYLETALQGVVEGVPMEYSDGAWSASLRVPSNASGLAMIEVRACANYTWGAYEYEAFIGYFMSDLNVTPGEPYLGATALEYNITELNGTPATGRFSLGLYRYEFFNNSYAPVAGYLVGPNGTVTLSLSSPGFEALVAKPPAYGVVPLEVGLGLNVSYHPQVIGGYSFAPGGCMYVEATVRAPAQAHGYPGLAGRLERGDNLTVYIIANHSGLLSYIYSAQLFYNSSAGAYLGCVRLPGFLGRGLYAVEVTASYDSVELGNVSGQYYGFIYVDQPLAAELLVPAYSMEGQGVEVRALITYPNGTPVRSGAFSVTAFPAAYPGLYGPLSEVQVPLSFNSSSGAWEATIVLPWTNGSGSLAGGWAPPTSWEVVLSGMSQEEVLAPVTAAVTQLPVTYYSDRDLAQGQFSPVSSYFYDVNVTFSGGLYDDVFAGTDYMVNSAAEVVDSLVNGTLVLVRSNVTLVGVTALNLVLVNSTVYLLQSNVTSVSVGPGSRVVVEEPYYVQVVAARLEAQLADYVQELEGNVSGLSAELGRDFSSLSGQVGALQLQVEDIAYNLTSLWQLSSSLRSNLTGLSYAVNASVAYARELYSEAVSAVSYVKAIPAEVNESLEGVYRNVSGLEESVSSLSQGLEGVSAELSVIRENISSLSGELRLQGAEVNGTQGRVMQLGAWLEGNVSELSARVTGLSTFTGSQVEELSGRQAALQRYAYAALGLSLAGLALAAYAVVPGLLRRPSGREAQ